MKISTSSHCVPSKRGLCVWNRLNQGPICWASVYVCLWWSQKACSTLLGDNLKSTYSQKIQGSVNPFTYLSNFIHSNSCILFHPGFDLYFPSDLMKKAMTTHSSILAWKIPWAEEPGRLQSMGLWRVGHNWTTSLSLFTFMHWRRKWQPTPVFLPGESQGRGSLVGCHLRGHTESDTTEAT